MEPNLILMTKRGKEVGFAPKSMCHRGKGLTHVAFSVYLFDKKDRLLIQKRSNEKMLWPGYWSNSYCSHPRSWERIEDVALLRCIDELGCQATNLEEVTRFYYQAPFVKDEELVGSENEYLFVYKARMKGKLSLNPSEVAEARLLSIDQVLEEMKQIPNEFTPWFKRGIKYFK